MSGESHVNVRRVVPNIASPDMDACMAFYVGFLGLEVVMDLGWIVTYASPTNPTAQISVSPGKAPAGEQFSPYLTIEVDDVDAAHALAVERGYEIVHPLTNETWGVRRFFVREPGGLVLNILGQTPLGDPSR